MPESSHTAKTGVKRNLRTLRIPSKRMGVLNRLIMENKEIRRANLLLLIDEAPTKKIRELAELTGVPENYISQIKGGTRKMGDDVARQLEQGMKKPVGWIDVPQNAKSRGKKPLTAEEWELIEAFRECSRERQETIFDLCQELRKK